MKRFLAVLLSLTMLVVLASCSSSSDSGSAGSAGEAADSGSAAVSAGDAVEDTGAGYPDEDVDYFARDAYNFVYAHYDDMPLTDATFASFEQCAEAYNFTITRVSASESPETYMQNIEVLIDRGDVDGFFIDTDPQFQDRLMSVLNDSGIPYINMYTAFYEDDSNQVPTVGLDQWQSGYDSMQWLVDHYTEYWGEDVDTATIGLIDMNFSVVQDLQLRVDGIEACFKEAFPGNENIFIVDGLTGGTVSPEVGFDLVSQTVAANKDIKYWFVGSSLEDFAQGAARAAESLGRDDEFLISDVGSIILPMEWDDGYDGSWKTCYAISQIAYCAPASLGLIAMADGRATKESLWADLRNPKDACTIWIADSSMVTKEDYKEYFASIDEKYGIA